MAKIEYLKEIFDRRMVSNLRTLGNRFCQKIIELDLFAKFYHIIHCFASVVGAIIAPSLDRGKKLLVKLFRGEKKPSKHLFGPTGQNIDAPFRK